MYREVKIKTKEYNICVNPFLECLGVVFVLADFNLNKTRTNKKYMEKINATFSNYKKHDLISEFKELLKIPSFKYDAPIKMILAMFYNTKPSLELLQRANLTYTDYQKLKIAFENFYNKIGFEIFFEDNKNYYIKCAIQFEKDIEKFSPEKFLFDFLGLSADNLNVLLMFGVTTSNYGICVDGQLFCCVRPYKESRFNDEIDFCYDLPYMTTLILHEFAHSFINPITNEFATTIDTLDNGIFAEIFARNPYGDHKETAINETIIRTIECLYLKNNFKQAYSQIKDEYIQDGFVLIPQLETVFEQYLSNRTKYKNIKDFYPEIIKILL